MRIKDNGNKEAADCINHNIRKAMKDAAEVGKDPLNSFGSSITMSLDKSKIYDAEYDFE